MTTQIHKYTNAQIHRHTNTIHKNLASLIANSRGTTSEVISQIHKKILCVSDGRTWHTTTPTDTVKGELGSARKGKMVRRVILLVGEETSVFRGENIWNFYLGLILGQGRVQCILRKCARDHVWVTVVQLSVQEVSRDKASLTLEIQIRVSGLC